MSIVHLLLTAISLTAFAGGAWGIDSALDRYAQIPEVTAAAEPAADEEDDPKLLY